MINPPVITGQWRCPPDHPDGAHRIWHTRSNRWGPDDRPELAPPEAFYVFITTTESLTDPRETT
jgi:hypothetical protein